MVLLAQKRFAGCFGGKHAGLAFDTEFAVEVAMARNEANHGLGEMDVEVVADDIPPCIGCGAAQLDFGQFRQPRESGILQGKWVRREFCYCLGFAETVKKLTRPIFDASNDR